MRIANLKFQIPCLCISLLSISGCANLDLPSTTQPAATEASDANSDSAIQWQLIEQVLGRKGEFRDGVYTVRIRRDDLNVTIEGMDVPTAAGIESTFRFYRCKCGKTIVLGQFILADYEANDVVYALQKEDILVSAISPFLIYEQPRLMMVNFQAEGQPQHLAQAIKSALNWTAKNRMPPRTMETNTP